MEEKISNAINLFELFRGSSVCLFHRLIQPSAVKMMNAVCISRFFNSSRHIIIRMKYFIRINIDIQYPLLFPIHLITKLLKSTGVIISAGIFIAVPHSVNKC